LLSAFEKYLHADDALPPLVRAGLLHVQFETIHPYLDGNGRIGRLLVTLLLEHWRLLTKPLLYLSLFFKRHRDDYYRRLNAVRVAGDWEGWLDFFLDGVATIADEAVASARELFALVAEDRVLVLAHDGMSVVALRLFELLPRHPVVTVASVMKLVQTTKAHSRSRDRAARGRRYTRRDDGQEARPNPSCTEGTSTDCVSVPSSTAQRQPPGRSSRACASPGPGPCAAKKRCCSKEAARGMGLAPEAWRKRTALYSCLGCASPAGHSGSRPARAQTGKLTMVRKLFVAAMVVVAVGLARVVPFTPSGEAQAAAECQKDADCKDGTFCILALNPHVCKPPMETGAACKARRGVRVEEVRYRRPAKRSAPASDMTKTARAAAPMPTRRAVRHARGQSLLAMLWLKRKTFSGSYSSLSATSFW
jgi:hypothetical protein